MSEMRCEVWPEAMGRPTLCTLHSGAAERAEMENSSAWGSENYTFLTLFIKELNCNNY